MKMKYITKVKSNLEIYTKKKTSNILEGSYNSIYKGKSMNFEDLREYVIGDNVKDIDWKSSVRANKVLVKQFIAEKKGEVAIMTVGTIGYIVHKHGDSIAMICNGKERIELTPFKNGLYNLEMLLNKYEKNIDVENNIEELINYVLKYIRRRMIIFIITDINGMNNTSENTLRKLSYLHDVFFINISDAMLTGYNAYDIDEEHYIPDFILEDKKMQQIESELKNKIYRKTKNKFKKYKIITTTINKQRDIVNDVFKLLERRKHANIS